jgi:hypothetical protein
METTNTSILVGLLTEEQKNQLVDQQFSTDCYFNPIQDANDNWIISTEEIQSCTNEELIWVKDLELIAFNPKPYEIFNTEPNIEPNTN